MPRTAQISPETALSQDLILTNATPALVENSRSIINSSRDFFQRFHADIRNRENIPARFRQSLEILLGHAGLVAMYITMFSGQTDVMLAGLVTTSVAWSSFLAEATIDNQRHRARVAVDEPNQIALARSGLQPELLNQVLNCGVASLLNDFSEAAIATLKTSPSPSAQDAVALMNHLFTQAPLATDLQASLGADSLTEARTQKDILIRNRLDYGANFYADQQRHPITDPCLIQTLAYTHFVGALQKARSTNDPDNNLPNVDLNDLLQKYEGFYERFTSHCETIHGESGREFAENFLHPILREFAQTGEDYTIVAPAPNHDGVVDIEAGLNQTPSNDIDEIAPVVFIDTPRTTTQRRSYGYNQIVQVANPLETSSSPDHQPSAHR